MEPPPPSAPDDVDAQTLRRTDSGESAQVGTTEPTSTAEKIGRYLIIDVLGRGGMGLVYTAFDPVLSRKVAIKVLNVKPQKGTESTGDSTRLLREAQAMAQLNHPNVVPVYDFGVAGDDVYVAMELVVGSTFYQWVKEKRPTWREVMPVMIAAGRGLQAAHDAGLLHRDFKPTNVLLDAGLHPHLTDFGLARSMKAISADTPVTSSLDPAAASSLDTPLTQAGQVMGSPGYMAPEQYAGAATSPATDQYAFCVTLYEALYGTRPFRGSDLKVLGRLVREGNVPPPPKGSPVPPWIFPLLQQGLKPDPFARHPSMAVLLDALSRDPARVRRRWLLGAAAVLLVAGVAGGTQWAQLRASQVCRASAGKLSGVWDDRARTQAKIAFLGTGKSWATVAWEHARDATDAYATAWAQARVEACEATHVRREQSERQLDLRNACLDRQLDELGTLATAFATADVTLIGQASSAVARLSPVSACANLTSLEARARLAPKSRDALERLQREVGQGRLLVAAGRLPLAREKLVPAAREALALGEPSLIAEAYEARGELERASGKFPEARTAYERATEAALEAGEDAQAARHLAALVSLVGWRLEHPAEGLVLASVARGLLARLGGDRATEAHIDEGIGDAQWQAGDRPASLVSYQKALETLVALHGDENLDVARLRSSAGWVMSEQGKLTEAREMLEHSHQVRERLLGPDHPLLGETWNEIGTLAAQGGDTHEAVRCFLRALEIDEQNLGPDASTLTRMRLNVAEALVEDGQLAEAVKAYAVAKQDVDRMTAPPATFRMQALRIASKCDAAQQNWASARQHAQDALQVALQNMGPTHPETGEALLQLARSHAGAGQAKEALATFDQYLEVAPKFALPANPSVAVALVGTGRALIALRKPSDAVARFERALDAIATFPGQVKVKADAQLGLADALWASGGDKKRARQLAESALEVMAEPARAWLDAHH